MKQRTDFTCSIRGGFVKFIHDAANQTYACRLGKGDSETAIACKEVRRGPHVKPRPAPSSV
jgi:hypothetical protein